jgi:hypothetical protein
MAPVASLSTGPAPPPSSSSRVVLTPLPLPSPLFYMLHTLLPAHFPNPPSLPPSSPPILLQIEEVQSTTKTQRVAVHTHIKVGAREGGRAGRREERREGRDFLSCSARPRRSGWPFLFVCKNDVEGRKGGRMTAHFSLPQFSQPSLLFSLPPSLFRRGLVSSPAPAMRSQLGPVWWAQRKDNSSLPPSLPPSLLPLGFGPGAWYW